MNPANLTTNVTLDFLVVVMFASHLDFRDKLASEEHALRMISVQECFNAMGKAIQNLVNVQNVKYSSEHHV